MDNQRKVTFKLDIGFYGAEREETFTLEELGLIKGENYQTESELKDLLEEAWTDWSNEYIEGGFYFDDE